MNKIDGVIRLKYGVFRYIIDNECVTKGWNQLRITKHRL